MLVSIDWIKDFVDLPEDISVDLVSDKVTLSTAEVEEVLETGGSFDQIIVSRIVSFKQHPDAEKLNLVTFDTGNGSKEVVCGAPNVKEGLLVAFAPIGVTLPNGLTLTPKKIRGVLSEGMLCSKSELGLSSESSGIWELPAEARVGQTLLDFLKKKKDIIVDIDNKSLTHRPDLWGHYGFAREFAAIWELPLKKPFNSDWSAKLKSHFTSDPSPVIPTMESDTSCLCYLGLSLDNVKVTESPNWMKERLINVGLRPINSIVDISNYVMLELGHPLHIFDRSLIVDEKINIHTLKNDVEFETLDEVKRSLKIGDTVISDSKKPLVLAGIMGGQNSGVNEQTERIFIEVANWKASKVRGTSTRLGLRTDSSQRYEKTLDSTQCERVMLRTLELILELNPNAKVLGKIEKIGNDETEQIKIQTSCNRINKLLGTKLEIEKIVKILTNLDFILEEKQGNLEILVPSFRATKDVSGEADIVEEIGRMIGYDNIKPEIPLWPVTPIELTNFQKAERKIKDFLSLNSRALEIYTYPLIGNKLLKKAHWNDLNDDLKLVNALSDEQDRMRPSLIPSMIEAAKVNCKNYESFRFFELGRSYISSEKNFFEERYQVAVGFFDRNKTSFLSLANTIEGLLRTLDLPFDFSTQEEKSKFKNPLIDQSWSGKHPIELLNIKIMGKYHGLINTLHPIIMKDNKIKGYFSFAVIDLTDVLARPIKDKKSFKEFSKYPASTFDCTVTMEKNRNVEDALNVLKKLKIKELKKIGIVDIFSLSDDFKSVTLRSTFLDPNKTLSGELLKKYENQVVDSLGNNGFPLKS